MSEMTEVERERLASVALEAAAWATLATGFDHDEGDVSGRATVGRILRESILLSATVAELRLALDTWETWGAATSWVIGLFVGSLKGDSTKEVEVRMQTMLATVRQMPDLDQPIVRLGRLLDADKLTSQLRVVRFDAALLAQAWVRRAELGVDEITRQQIDALAERHYRKGELEPNGDTVPHPWRMTIELAEAISGLLVEVEREDSTEEELKRAARRITEAARAGLGT